MQPIRFIPFLKSTLWGGNRIITFKNLETQQEHVGESWEISGVEGCETIVADGPYQGMSLNQLVATLKEKLVGKDNYERFGNEFPLLIKFIDAHQDLSIQVHPDDETAQRMRKPRGKTEMWYVMDSDPGAYLYSGLKQHITPEDYERMVADDTICDALAKYEVGDGDVFYLPAGRIHAIGTGCFLAEIQETSDVTYRIYDYRRRDKDGNLRQLHTREAAECIDYHVEPDYRTHYTPRRNEGVQLISCPYFTTAVYDLDEPMTLDYSELDSFVALIALSGEGTVVDDEGNSTPFAAGQTLLLPATTTEIKITGTLKFLETYV